MNRRAAFLAAGAALVWLVYGVHRIAPTEFGVLHGPLLFGRLHHVGPGYALVPPGLLKLARYPAEPVELALPTAGELQSSSPGGSRFGFQGWITVQAEGAAWAALHRAAAGRGIRGALLEAARAAAAGVAVGPGPPDRLAAAERARLEGALQRALAERGLALRRLDLDRLDFPTSTLAGARIDAAARLLIVGLDGADWSILDPLLLQGRMPNLQRLVDEGVRARLLSIRPMLSPVVWTSVATGVEPVRHGILDFLVADPDGGARQPVTSVQRQAPAFWELLSESGVPVGVTGWWASWPADPVRGYLVSDRIAYQLFGFRADPADARGKTWPPELYDEIRPWIVTPEAIPSERLERFFAGPAAPAGREEAGEQERLDGLRTLLASGDTYVGIALELARRRPTALQVVYLEGTDTVGHLFMPFRPPALPGVSPEQAARYGEVVDRYYVEADRLLGQLLQGKGADWTVMLLSDHGFASDQTRPQRSDSRIGHGAAADWHRRFGILVLSGAGIRRGVTLDEASVYDIAPTVLHRFGLPVPRDWPGRVLLEALTDEFVAGRPLLWTAESPVRGSPVADSPELDSGAADLLRKLTSLGYLSSSGSSAEGSVSAQNNTGVALMSAGRLAEAEAAFRAGLEWQPRSPNLLANLGLVLRLLRRDDEAEPYLVQSLDHPSTRRLAVQQLARLRVDRGELDEAERLLRTELRGEPNASELQGALGQVLLRRGDMQGAERSFRRAAELDPHNAWARNDLGNLFQARGSPEEAAQWYREAIEADPYFIGPYNNLALVYQARGRLGEAADLYERAANKAPRSAVVLNNLASLHYARGDFPAARELWSRCRELDAAYVSPLNNLAGLALAEGRDDDAEALLHEALRLDPQYGDALINLSLVLRRRGAWDAARAELVRATEDRRAGYRPWLQLGLLELERQAPAPAIEPLTRARTLAPENVEVLNALGQAHFSNRDPGAALPLWRRSLELDPGQAELSTLVQRVTRATADDRSGSNVEQEVGSE